MSEYPMLVVYIQILINGILFGSMYGVAALGLSLIFGSMQIIFIAQGTVIILSSYFTYWLFTLLNLEPFICLILFIPVFLGIGWMLYAALFQRVMQAGKNPTLLLAFGLMILLENLMSVIWTSDPRAIKTTYTAFSLSLGGIRISFTRLMVFVTSLLATGMVYWFLKRTMWGKAVRAASKDMKAASLLGISPKKVSGLTFSIGIALAGIAGVATATTYPFDPYFGFAFSLKALIAVAFGGLGNIGGALLGGILLGVLESMGSFVLSGGWADAISYGAFLLVIMFRPQGIFGRRVRTV